MVRFHQALRQGALLILGLALVLWPSGRLAASDAQPPPAQDYGYVGLTVANDVIASGDDRHFSNGVKIDWSPRTRKRVFGLAPLLERLMPKPESASGLRQYFSFGQNMYTPEDITVATLIEEERPYAGWMYLGFGHFVATSVHVDRAEITLGVVGPASLASTMHKAWHRWFNFTKPLGWNNQLDNEPGIILFYERQWPLTFWKARSGFTLQAAPHANVSLGNIFTYAGAGMAMRFGQFDGDAFGIQRIQPGLPGSVYIAEPQGRAISWYIYAAVEGRAIARNIFLDGNTFANSHKVDKQHLVGDLVLGVVFIFRGAPGAGPIRLSYSYILRSEEFEGQDGPDKFASLTLSFRY